MRTPKGSSRRKIRYGSHRILINFLRNQLIPRVNQAQEGSAKDLFRMSMASLGKRMDLLGEISEIKVRKYFVRLPKDIIKFLNEVNDFLQQIQLGNDVVIQWLQ